MKLDYLPKLLLQHDASPYLNELNLIRACESEKLVYCVHPRGFDIAVALGQRLVFFRAYPGSLPTNTPEPPHFITPTQAPESITSIAWLWSASTNDSCLAVGTSAGFLQLHSFPEGALLHRQELGDTPIVSIIVRWSGSGLDPQNAAEEITIGFENAVVRIPAYDIWPAVRWHMRAVQLHSSSMTTPSSSTTSSSRWWGTTGLSNIVSTAGHAPQITPVKYYLKKSIGARTAAACVGPAAPSLSSLLARRQDPPHRGVIFTTGADPPFASFVVEESQSGGSILSLVAGLASTSASELFGRAKSFLPGGGGGASLNTGSRPSTPTSLGGGTSSSTPGSINSNSLTPASSATDTSTGKKKREKIPGATIYHESAVWDEAKRKISHTAMSPCCRWAACCDSVGRVLLIDVSTCVVLKMLKGYREAQAAWFIPGEINLQQGDTTRKKNLQTKHSNKDGLNTSTATTGSGSLLVVYAPRRGVIELWKPHSGVRVGSISPVPQRGVLLEQPAVPKSLIQHRHTQSSFSLSASSYQSWPSFQSNSCWMLDLESLELVDLTEKLNKLISVL